MRYETFKDEKNEWRWRAIAVNGKIVATSGEGYKNKVDCENMMDVVRNAKGINPIEKCTKKKSLLQRIREFIWGSED